MKEDKKDEIVIKRRKRVTEFAIVVVLWGSFTLKFAFCVSVWLLSKNINKGNGGRRG